MIQISFLTGQLILLGGWLLYRLAAFWKNKRIDWKNELRQIFFLINLLVILRFTFYPFSKVDGKVQPLIFDAAAVLPLRVNLVPFRLLTDYESKRDMLINIIGNFAMFIPTGVMVPLIYKSRNTLLRAVGVGVLLSLIIELIQLPFAVRASDIDDLILNTAGCLLGYGLYAIARTIRRAICRRRTKSAQSAPA